MFIFHLLNIISEPGLYKKKEYGIRLKDVLEVYDTGERHPSGARFLGFRDVSLVPFEPKLIDRGILSLQEVNFNFLNRKIMSIQLNVFSFFLSFFIRRNDGSTNTMHVFER